MRGPYDITENLRSRFNDAGVSILQRWDDAGFPKLTVAEEAAIEGFKRLMDTTADVPAALMDRVKPLATNEPDKYSAAVEFVGKSSNNA